VNLFRLLKLYRRANTVVSLIEEANVKSLWKSKTLWFNLLTAGLSLLEVLPLPPEKAVMAAAIINMALRLVTTQGLTAQPTKPAEPVDPAELPESPESPKPLSSLHR
jgi:hypothetical protein